jgi:hypothetical protein
VEAPFGRWCGRQYADWIARIDIQRSA